MAVLTRTNYVPNTLIQSAPVNADFNQLVDLLSGVSTNKDALIKYSNATDPVLRVDQLGAGIIQEWLQNGTRKGKVNNDGSLNIGTPGASPTNGLVGGPDSSGTNTAGAHLDFHGGKGTGNAEPGQLAARYPLRTASGTTVHALSSNRYPVKTALFTNTANGTAVANTTNETSLLTGATASAGSTLTIEAGITAPGTRYRIRVQGSLGTTGTPTGQFRVKLGSTTVGDSGAFNMPTNAGGVFDFDVTIRIFSVGASGATGTRTRFEGVIGGGVQTPTIVHSSGTANIDLTAAQAIDITFQWGTANAANTITLTDLIIERIR